MYKVKKNSNPFYIESNQTFRQIFLTNLNKLNESSTKKTGLDEIRDLLTSHIQDADRMNLVLTLLSENSEHQKASGKRETMRIIGIMAEVFEEKLANFIPKILQILSKKLKENDPQMHDTLSASVASIVSFTIRNLELDAGFKSLQSILAMLFQLCKGNRYSQIGSAMCITKVIQSSPFEFLYTMVDEIAIKIIELLQQHTCKAHIQLFECLLSLIVAFEGNGEKLQESGKNILPVTIDNLTNGDWNVRKIAVELIYTLSVLTPETIRPYKHELLDVLGHCRFDKIKNVRESSSTAITRIKELEDPENPAKLFNLNSEYGDNIPEHEKTSTATFNENHLQITGSDPYQSQSLKISDINVQNEKWTRSPPRERGRKQSPSTRTGLKMNPEFFNNAPKHKGDIEIYTKSPPPKEFAMETENSGKKLRSAQNEPNVQVQTSPNRTFKYIISNPVPPDYDESENWHPQENREELNKNKQNPLEKYKNFKFELLEKKSIANPNLPLQREEKEKKVIKLDESDAEEKRIKREHERKREKKEEDLNNPVRKNSGESLHNTVDFEQKKQTFFQTNSEHEQEHRQATSKYSNKDFDNVFKQLLEISEQQTVMMEKLADFQGSTQNELHYLRSRVKYLEDFIQKAYHPHKGGAPGYSYPPHHYTYMPPYQSLGPQSTHPSYQVQYTNFIPPHYPPQGAGSFDQNSMLKFTAAVSRPSKNEAGHSGYLSKKQSTERNSRAQGGRMEQESQYHTSSKEKLKSDSQWDGKGREQIQREELHLHSDDGAIQINKNVIWERIQELLTKNEINRAYELCLNEGDEETVLNLMRETGNIVEHLDIAIVENMFINLKSRVFDEEQRDMVLNWIEKGLHEKLDISRGIWIALHDVIIQLSEKGTKVSGLTVGRVKKLAKEIALMLDDTMPLEKNQPREDVGQDLKQEDMGDRNDIDDSQEI